jgi:hypothetical protein
MLFSPLALHLHPAPFHASNLLLSSLLVAPRLFPTTAALILHVMSYSFIYQVSIDNVLSKRFVM